MSVVEAEAMAYAAAAAAAARAGIPTGERITPYYARNSMIGFTKYTKPDYIFVPDTGSRNTEYPAKR